MGTDLAVEHYIVGPADVSLSWQLSDVVPLYGVERIVARSILVLLDGLRESGGVVSRDPTVRLLDGGMASVGVHVRAVDLAGGMEVHVGVPILAGLLQFNEVT